jgi:hypothetical protein
MDHPTFHDQPLSAAQAVRRACARVFGVDEVRMIGRARTRDLTLPRQAACYVLRKRFPAMSYPTIARLMGGRDHSTIIYSVQVTEARIRTDPELAGKVFALIGDKIGGKRYDAHVIQWLAFRQARAAMQGFALPGPVHGMTPIDLGEELAEFMEGPRYWCDQCDRAATDIEVRSCQQRLCPSRAAPLHLRLAA